jgi:hypothetical protein
MSLLFDIIKVTDFLRWPDRIQMSGTGLGAGRAW